NQRRDDRQEVSHATSHPQSRASQRQQEMETRQNEALNVPPVLPQEMTAESHSGHPRQDSTELEVLRRKIAELESRQKAQEDTPRRASTSVQVYLEADSPLAPELTSEPVPGKVKVPQFGLYDGTSDPDAHLGHYTSWMDLHGASDALRCRMFSLSLGPRAQKWYHFLPPHSIWKWQ
ncbi:Unknown protein, partial [Striga hermonthica]